MGPLTRTECDLLRRLNKRNPFPWKWRKGEFGDSEILDANGNDISSSDDAPYDKAIVAAVNYATGWIQEKPTHPEPEAQ